MFLDFINKENRRATEGDPGESESLKINSLADKFSSQFASAAQDKGAELFKKQWIHLEGRAQDTFTFIASGNYDYKLDLVLDNDNLQAHCNCSYFEDGQMCKHLWAALLSLDSQSIQLKANVLSRVSDQSTESQVKIINNSSVDLLSVPVISIGDTESLTPTESSMPEWQVKIERVQKQVQDKQKTNVEQVKNILLKQSRRLGLYAIDLQKSLQVGKLILQFYAQEELKNGAHGAIKSVNLSHDDLDLYSDPLDKQILWSVLGKTTGVNEYQSLFQLERRQYCALEQEFSSDILKTISDAGKLFIIMEGGRYKKNDFYLKPIKLQPDFCKTVLELIKHDSSWFLRAYLSSKNSQKNADPSSEGAAGEIKRKMNEVTAVVDNFVFFADSLFVSDLSEYKEWQNLFLKNQAIEIPETDLNDFLKYYYKNNKAPFLKLPDTLQFEEVRNDPEISLNFNKRNNNNLLETELAFSYGTVSIGADLDYENRIVIDVDTRQNIYRNIQLEKINIDKFLALPAQFPSSSKDKKIAYVSDSKFIEVVEKAIEHGWKVQAFNKNIYRGKNYKSSLSSTVDWFDLSAEFHFEGRVLGMPELLQNLRSGQRMITFKDGSMGILPQEWLNQFSSIAQSAKLVDGGLRLSKVQAIFLAASMGEGDKLTENVKLSSLHQILKSLNQLDDAEACKEFQGELRSYQKKGLSWLNIISKEEIGGVLADDMGLGKTIQLLAALSDQSETERLPSLVVAPKSLIFNWQNEAVKFTPHLKVLNFTGIRRREVLKDINAADIVLTTYQTLRTEIETFKQLKFNFFILDEAQYIKNPDSQSYMACRLISAKKKFALTGTPIENSIGDLFSILSIVTPGLVSKSVEQRFKKSVTGEELKSFSKALRPFVLRRTKEQVLKDLPEKSEQVLYCELTPEERQKYNDLKTYYWGQLQSKFDSQGLEKSKIDILEALLRLRQASCHQGLLDNTLTDHSSTKIDVLLEQIATVIADGHKALIFSQFTSFLAIVKKQLDRENIQYEYLDGQTQNREQIVNNFQSNPDKKLFLLSLKAGGVGLNLTAADYVFILDPWWNPAAESQAIDRAHRIGQTRKVFAYKLIAKDTVEEKILELQKTKKDLAESVISDEKSLIRKMTMDDLKLLFA